MAYEVIWTAEADKDLFYIANYLRENWSENSALKFVNNVTRKIEKLSQMPSLGRPTTREGHYMCKLDRKNILFFEIDDNYIVLLSIYPYKKDITRSEYY
jgi:plasmid stabilization system protein ParE